MSLLILTYISSTTFVCSSIRFNILTKGASSGGKSFTILGHVLGLVGPDFVNKLTSSSALTLVYDYASAFSYGDVSVRSKSIADRKAGRYGQHIRDACSHAYQLRDVLFIRPRSRNTELADR